MASNVVPQLRDFPVRIGCFSSGYRKSPYVAGVVCLSGSHFHLRAREGSFDPSTKRLTPAPTATPVRLRSTHLHESVAPPLLYPLCQHHNFLPKPQPPTSH